MPIKYPTEFKVKAIRRYEKGESIKELCKELNISQSTLYHWRKQYCSIQTDTRTYTPAEFDAISRRLRKVEHELEVIRLSGYIARIPLQNKLATLEHLHTKKNSTQLITSTFKIAHEERHPPSGLIFHSDRGAQYTSHRFQQLLHEHNTKQSFSQPGKPHDNAVAESFFASLKKEELYRKDHPSDRAFQASVASYIEFYNTKRPHRTLKNLTPCQTEENFNKNAK